MDSLIDDELPEDANIWTINSAVYAAARQLVPQQRGESALDRVGKVKRRVQKIEAKIKSARQHGSRIQGVVEYVTVAKPFTSKIRRIVGEIRRQHHTLNRTVLQTIKQHCLDMIRALMAIKKSLVRRARGMEQNYLFQTTSSRLFQEPQRVVENPPAVDNVETFCKGIYETTSPFDNDTPAIAHFEAFCHRLVEGQGEVCPAITAEEVALWIWRSPT